MKHGAIVPIILFILLLSLILMTALSTSLGIDPLCKGTYIDYFYEDNQPSVCYDSNLKNLKFTIKNSGDTVINEIKVEVFGEKNIVKKIKSDIQPNTGLTSSVLTDEFTKVKFTPIRHSLLECGGMEIAREMIPEC